MPKPKKDDTLLPAKAGVDQVSYLAELTGKCTAPDFGQIIAKLKDIAINGEPNQAIKASKLLLDTFMDLLKTFPAHQLPEEESRRIGQLPEEFLTRLTEAIDIANRSAAVTDFAETS